jgi:hypothetical protein
MSSFIANVGLVGTVAIINTNVIMDPLTKILVDLVYFKWCTDLSVTVLFIHSKSTVTILKPSFEIRIHLNYPLDIKHILYLV